MYNDVEFLVDGLNSARFVSDLARLGVNLTKVTPITRSEFTFRVKKNDTYKVVDYIEKRCYNTKYSQKNVSGIIPWCASHWVVLALAIVFVIALFICGDKCLAIVTDYSGDRSTLVEQIDNFGVSIGSSLSRLNLDELENYLCRNLDGALYAIAEVRGSTLFVSVIDTVDLSPVVDYTARHDVVATFDGVITRMVVVSGTPVVEVGQKVTAGQTLVEGVRTFTDGSRQNVRAVAEVYATVYYSHTVEFVPTVIEYVRSGETLSRSSLLLAKKTVQSKSALTFTHYEVEQSEYYLQPLNIKVIDSVYYELKPLVKNYTFEQRLSYMKEQALNGALNNCPFKPIYVQYIIGDNCVTALLQAEQMINAERFGG